jgi:hypothetical protein
MAARCGISWFRGSIELPVLISANDLLRRSVLDGSPIDLIVSFVSRRKPAPPADGPPTVPTDDAIRYLATVKRKFAGELPASTRSSSPSYVSAGAGGL